MGSGTTITPEHVKLYTSDGKVLAIMWNGHGVWTNTPPNRADADDTSDCAPDLSEVL